MLNSSFPHHPCTITLIDSFSYIEVYVKSPPAVGKKLCRMICDQLLDGIKAASEVLHYNNDTPQVSIFCPCTQSTEKQHLAEINTGWILDLFVCKQEFGVKEVPSPSRVWLRKFK